VDERGTRHYASITMRLLLLLSAFLTALIGVGQTAPATARPVCELSAPATTGTERKAPLIAAVLPHQLGALDLVDAGSNETSNAVMRALPLYADRLRV
jgi:hypothetical protein